MEYAVTAMGLAGTVFKVFKAGSATTSPGIVNPEEQDTRRILVFGATKSGKTSLINALTGRADPVSNGARGVTFKSHWITGTKTFEEEGVVHYSIIDTAGLDEPKQGTVPTQKPIENLLTLFGQLHRSGGLHLLVYVIRQGALTTSVIANHQLLMHGIAGGRVPYLIVVTNCDDREADEGLQDWVQNEEHITAFREHDMAGYKELLGTCFMSSKCRHYNAEMAAEVGESTQLVWRHILENTRQGPVQLGGEGEPFKALVHRLFNTLCSVCGSNIRFGAAASIKAMLKMLNFSEAEAAEMSDKFTGPRAPLV